MTSMVKSLCATLISMRSNKMSLHHRLPQTISFFNLLMKPQLLLLWPGFQANIIKVSWPPGQQMAALCSQAKTELLQEC